MKDPLAGYYFAGGNVGFRPRPQTPQLPPDNTPGAVPQNMVPSPTSDAEPVQDVPPAAAPPPPQGGGDDGGGDGPSQSGQGQSLQDTFEGFGADPATAQSWARSIDPFEHIDTPGGGAITGGFGGDAGSSNNYGLSRSHGNAQGISQVQQDLGWDLTRYGSFANIDTPIGSIGILPGQGIAKEVGGRLLDRQIDAIDSSFDALGENRQISEGVQAGYDDLGLDETVTISDALGNVHSMTKAEYEAQQAQPGSATWAADYNAGNLASTQQYGDANVTTNPTAAGGTSSFIDSNGDGVQQSNERGVVTSSDGTAVRGGSGVVTSRSADEVAGLGPGAASTTGVADEFATWDSVANDPSWGGTAVEDETNWG